MFILAAITSTYSLFITENCSTCFGWYFHPSSGAHTTVSTASGICQTVTDICRYPDDGWKYHTKHVEQFPDINKLYNVAPCWVYEYIVILLGARPILHICRIKFKVRVCGIEFSYFTDVKNYEHSAEICSCWA
jgi:hypothetical protein